MNNFKITLNDKQIDSDNVFQFVKEGNLRKAIIYMEQETGCSKDEAYKVYKELRQMINPKPLSQEESTLVKKQHDQKRIINQPKCPTCGSTNIEKISLTKKATGGLLFGIFSSDVRKQMHCKDCGYKW